MVTRKITRRVEWVDVLKGICMVAVMISHSGPPTVVKQIYTPFFLPAFFFASGYTFSIKNSFKEFLDSKVRGILIPLVSLSLINGVVGMFKGVPYYVRLLGIIIQQAGGYESLWFFACLFTCEILFYGIVKYSRGLKEVLICAHFVGGGAFTYVRFIGIALPWQFELACIALIFVSWGFAFRLHEEEMAFLDKTSTILIITCIYCFTCLVYNNNVNMHDERFGIEILYVLEALLGISALVGISKKIKHNKALTYVGTHTIIYFAFQGQLLHVLKAVLSRIGVESQLLQSFGAVCFALPILSIVAFIIYEYFPFIIGKKKVKR